MRFVIKCLSDNGFDFPTNFDYSAFFPDGHIVIEKSPSLIQVTLPWGVGTFKFSSFTVVADFKYNSIDFGYTEPLVSQLAARVAVSTGTKNKYWQVPVHRR